MKFEYVFFGLFALVAANMLRKVVKNGGLRGAFFGAPIRSTVSEIELHRRGMVKSRLKVHTLAGDSSAPKVGVEIVYTTALSWQMMPISLSTEEARHLAEALNRAANDSDR